MTDPASQPAATRWPLRRFVAWSLLAHLGAGVAWGIPALLTRLAEQERLQEEAAAARNLLLEAVKAKEHARQQQTEATRREVERELRKEFDKLAAALSEAKREALWQEVAKRTAAESTNLAEALGKNGTTEQDLRTLEAELQQAMVRNLDEVVTAASARELADRFVEQVESQVAPGLAKTMQDELGRRVAQQMREEADRLIAKQREDAKRADRAVVASAAIRAAVEAELSTQVERVLGDELAQTTLPRLAGKLQEGFKQQLDANGMSDDALVAQVGKEVQERLAKAVPAMAKAGDAAIDATFSDLPTAAAGAAEGAAKPSPGDSLLDKALAEGLASMGANAAKRVSEITANASRDAALVDQATRGLSEASRTSAATSSDAAATAAADSAAMAGLRDSIGALARSAGNGRLSTSTSLAANVNALRESALARGRGATRDEAAYADVAGQLAGRTAVQGERWTRQGAHGATAQAAEAVGARPAQVVGRAVGEARPALANDQAYVPTFKTLAFATLPYCTASFRIDGKLEKWDALPAIELRPEHGGDRSRQVVKLAWSNAGVFIHCRITDPNRRIDKAEPGNFWESDSVELWLDAFNSKEKYRTRQIGQQFWLWPAGSASDPALTGGEAVVAERKGAHRYVPLRADRLERWAMQTAEGWVMEARIPPALINHADLAAGRILGFNIYVNTMGGTDWYWSAGDQVSTSVQPDTWGDLLLAGADGTVEVLCGDTARSVLAVGEPLRLRVSDSDMDLDAAVRDKVLVTLKSHAGQQIAVLEETGVSTGVFEGAVTTALALDQPVPAVLSVFEGERVSVVYVDQARANGAREALLSTSVAFGAAVMGAGPTAKR